MDDVNIFGGLQVKVLVGQSGNSVGWVGDICHSKCHGVVKVDNSLVLNVSNLAAMIYVMLAIPPVLCDQVGVSFTRRGCDLYFPSDSQDAFHLPRIDEQKPHWSHAAVQGAPACLRDCATALPRCWPQLCTPCPHSPAKFGGGPPLG